MMEGTFAIRSASMADRDELRALQAKSMRILGLAYYDEDVIESFITNVGTMDDTLLDDGTYFAAYDGNSLVGCGGWTLRTPGYAAHIRDRALDLKGAATLRSIFVHPAFARRGIARQIMRTIEQAVRATGAARATMTATLSGLPFYKRLGYRSGPAVTIDLPDNLHFAGVVMTKTL